MRADRQDPFDALMLEALAEPEPAADLAARAVERALRSAPRPVAAGSRRSWGWAVGAAAGILVVVGLALLAFLPGSGTEAGLVDGVLAELGVMESKPASLAALSLTTEGAWFGWTWSDVSASIGTAADGMAIGLSWAVLAAVLGVVLLGVGTVEGRRA